MDDPFTSRPTLQELFATDDAARASYDEWEQRQIAREQAEAQQTTIYKRYEQDEADEPEPAPTPQHQAPTMPAHQKAWDDFVQGHIQQALAVHMETLQEIIAHVLVEERRAMREHIAEQIGSLRADMNIQLGVAKGEITELKSKKDAA